MTEPEVVHKTHEFLARWRLEGEPFTQVFTDPHHTLLPDASLKPFQRFRIDYAGQGVHPDLLAWQHESGALLAIEAKGDDGAALQGLSQAEAYLSGVQRSFLALPRARIGQDLLGVARERGIGVIGVNESVEVLHQPAARRPFDKPYRALMQALESASWVQSSGTFTYNLPTHYLVWTLLIPAGEEANFTAVEQLLGRYPMPKDWRAALRGAQKLGLVSSDGVAVRLTEAGQVVRRLMPTLAEWGAIHDRLSARQVGLTLAQLHPASAGALALLLLQDPIVRLLLEGLRELGPQGASFDELAARCAQRDRTRSLIFFLHPDASAAIAMNDSAIDWAGLPGTAYRSTTFFQYKSVLKHAGLLAPEALGGANARHYSPARDRWRAA